ncbi:SRPBCC domain-containing protein [Geomicrobium sp. JSM 1781026]|uniref:SRPBCC domain-containing protein n=1 Tax=Geomicrobium sp. JSM 1781026 TaxID=3344580 RepID=UPI0035BF9638
MVEGNGEKRIDTASKIIMADAETIYRAFLDPASFALWLPPEGMSGQVDTFDAREGGTYRMILTYEQASFPGKTSENTDVYQGKFVELVPNERIVQIVMFESDDRAYRGAMTQKWLMLSLTEGTKVTIVCEDVPNGIRQEDHQVGLTSTLENLAKFVT